jgi:outer membrane receptor protein involved in Fe transport
MRYKNITGTAHAVSALSRIFPAVLAAFLVIGSLAGQTAGRIAGTVTSTETGEPLPGTNVLIVGTNMGAATGIDGRYYILNIPPGRYEVRASMMGYQAMVVQDVVVHVGRTTDLNFELSDDVLEFEEVIVRAERPDVERDKTSTSHIVRFDEVEAIPGIRDIGDVIGLAADVIDGHFRGGRIGEEYYTLQGMGIVNPLDNSSAFMPIMSAVEEVEVITSGFGAQYGNAQSGVVNISMREGSRDRWDTRIETRTRAPGRKHFGPSVFDPNANRYLQLLQDSDTWLRGDPSGELAQPIYGRMAVGLTSSFAGDTTVQLAVAQALYDQMRRDMGRTYGENPDYSIELGTGGPLSERTRMFMALRSNRVWPMLPTERPNVEYQVMGNVVVDVGEGSALRLSGGFSHDDDNVFPSSNSVSGYQAWLWDRIVSINYRKRTNAQLGARYTQVVSPSTYYELQLNSVFTNNIVGSTPVPGALPDSLSFNWVTGTLAYPNNNSPDGMNVMVGSHNFTDQFTRTISFDGSITSQVTNAHLLTAGVQVNSYHIDVSNFMSVRTNRFVDNYTATPFEGAVYVQDKMEFESMIANFGLRFDVWYSGVDSYTDIYRPFLEPDSLGWFDPSAGPREKPPIHARLQPRVGVSFPVAAGTVFHLNYGAFMQRPSFQYIVSSRLTQIGNTPVTLGNPRLRPEVTNQYDVGVMQSLGEGFTLDVSGYYRDVKDLIQQANFVDIESGLQVNSFFNLDYADIRGFRVALNKRRGELTGSINYQFGYATGKSPNATAATPIFNRDREGNVTTELTNVPTRDIVLDFDRTHNLIITASYVTGREWGPDVFGAHPFANMNLSMLSSVRSGRPYTSPSDLRAINVERAPMEYNTDLRLTKTFRDFFGIPARFYFEVFNVFNNKILNYDYLFSRPTATNPNLPLRYYEQFGADHPEGPRYWYNKGTQGQFSVDQSFLLYSNQPRSFSFGMVLEF